jgi:hypothetical protein
VTNLTGKTVMTPAAPQFPQVAAAVAMPGSQKTSMRAMSAGDDVSSACRRQLVARCAVAPPRRNTSACVIMSVFAPRIAINVGTGS